MRGQSLTPTGERDVAPSASTDPGWRLATVGHSRLEYRLAFDLAAAMLFGNARADSRIALLASSPSFVPEWLVRTTNPPTIIVDSERIAATARALVDGWAPDEKVVVLGTLYAKASTTTAEHDGALWASPLPGTWRTLFDGLDGILTGDASLVVLTAGRLGWLSGSVGRCFTAGEPRLPVRGLDRELERRGYRTENVFTIGGIDAFRWAALARVAKLAGRPDLADRCEAGYRLALVPRRRGQVGLFTLIAARKTRRGA